MKTPNSIHIAESITSTANAEVKFLRALHERKYRRQSGWFLAEGTRICSEAVALGWEMHRLAFLAGRETEPHMRMLLDALDETDGRVLPMSEKLLQRISRKDNPQMVLGAFRQKWTDLDTISPDQAHLWVALDRVRDPGNLGTIMRSADAVGAKGIILIDDCTDPYSVEAVRASMGAIFNVEIVHCNQSDFLDFAQSWTSNQGQIIGTALPASVDYRDADYNGALMILMGNEQAGLPPALMQACTQLIRLPMLGRSDSLNLAVATGVTLYEAIRIRR